ncbi:phosphoribosylamine--glycine ligase [bacterium]|nr:phosphoribosylamine--glycine ligase [bacterium]MBU1984628.1 phosphoribosylamine--glycine ligase [bacterium]
MRIAVIGSGGREHAILWRLQRDSDPHSLFALPGNGGTHRIATSVQTGAASVPELMNAIRTVSPDLVVVGPEVPLAAGLGDALAEEGIPCFGPTSAAARIESSKVFAKRFMSDCGIATAEYAVFDRFDELLKHVESRPNPERWVVKADGLAAGKGAFVCSSRQEVLAHAHALLVDKKLGDAGRNIVLERRLEGREVSCLFWCDGTNHAPIPPAQDYKRAEDGDRGPNTGGMGSYCPAQHLTPELQVDISRTIVTPLLKTLQERETPYRGVLYAGLMLTDDGPQVIEFNCRFGDPETQAILPIWEGNLASVMMACATGQLDPQSRGDSSSGRTAVCVVLAAEGYPGNYEKHFPLVEVEDSDTQITFHAGTVRENAAPFSAGGRVLNAIGLGCDADEARTRAYDLAGRLKVPGLHFRRDIASNV